MSQVGFYLLIKLNILVRKDQLFYNYIFNLLIWQIYALNLEFNYVIILQLIILFVVLLILILCVIVSVGFFTLLERKIIGFAHNRKGPNKVGYIGILQPFRDGAKLFLKEQVFIINSNYLVYFICPIIVLIQSLFIWGLFPFFVNSLEFNYGFLFFLRISRLGIYGIIICGWSSNRIYALLGCIRRISQAISYEVSLSLILLSFFLISDRYNFTSIKINQELR